MPAKEAFIGFGDEMVIIVASALVVSAAIARSGITESLLRPFVPYLKTTPRRSLVLVAIVTVSRRS